MSVKLRDMIKSIRTCKTAAEERTVISKECASIRTAFKNGQTQHRHRNVAKLLFINMLGFPTHFGQLECLKLIVSSKFEEKRVGYLGLTCLLDEETEVLMLVTNSIKNDLCHANQYVNGLALCALANIGNEEMCRVLAQEVGSLLLVSNPYVKKKAALCVMRILRQVDDIEEKFSASISSLLSDRSNGVILSGCTVLSSLLRNCTNSEEKDYVSQFRPVIPQLLRVLKALLLPNSSLSADYDISGVTDPFLQVKLIGLLRLLLPGAEPHITDQASDVLAQVATNTEGSRNVGNSILYECVQTIMALQATSGLRMLGVTILGRFLENRDNNIRYVALSSLQLIVKIDSQAVQRHRTVILECLKDQDLSIKKKALELTFALVNHDNIKTMTKELLNFFLLAESCLKADLVMRICMAVEKYAPERRWYFDSIIKVMCLAGSAVQVETRNSFIHMLASSCEQQAYVTNKLFFSMRENSGQLRLIECGLWCIGEYGSLLLAGLTVTAADQPIVKGSDILDLFELVSKMSDHSEVSEAGDSTELHRIFLTSLLKLSAHLPDSIQRILNMIKPFRSSVSTELQQRTYEYKHLLGPEWDSTRKQILDRTPPPPKSLPFEESATPPPQSACDLLDLLDEATTPPQKGVAPIKKSGTMGAAHGIGVAAAEADLLGDLLDGLDFDTPKHRPPPLKTSPEDENLFPKKENGLEDLFASSAPQGFEDVEVFNKDGLRITFKFFKDRPDAPNSSVTAHYHNNSDQLFKSFVFEVAVPKYLSLEIKAASASTIHPGEVATQVINLNNSQYGQRAMVIKVRLTYTTGAGESVQEFLNVSNFPKGL